MKAFFRRKLVSLQFSLGSTFIAVTVLTSLLLGTTTYLSVSAFIREGIRERLRDTVSVAALQVDARKHQALLAPGDEADADYLAIKKSLQQIRDRLRDVRYVYTLRKDAAGKILFVVDAEEDPDSVSHIGDPVEVVTPAMEAAFVAPYGSQVESRFNSDKWGTWLSSYAPFFSADGRLEGVLGIDISAQQIVNYEGRYRNIVLLLSLAGSLLVIGLSVLVSRRISRPLLMLEAEMSRVRNFELDHPLQISSRVKEFVRMKTAVDNMKGGLRSFKKYVPADLVAELITLGKEALLGAEKREMTVFFSDIADFTSISERISPEALAGHMAVYFEGMTRTILLHRGTIDKYIGDAVMAFWGAPIPRADHALLACRAALGCRSFLRELAGKAESDGAPVFKTRIGIDSGEAIVGNMGYEERMNYTVMGDHVNLASRLESLNKVYGTQILISANTRTLVADEIEARMIDIVAVKGKKQGVAIYELVAERGQLDAETKTCLDRFNQAMDLYLDRRWGEAAAIFADLGRRNPQDRPAQLLCERCRRYATEPPDADWAGVMELTQK